MICKRSMTSLAVHARVPALAFDIENIRVAGLAGFVSGKLHWPCTNLANRSPAIMPILSEAARNDVTSDNKKDDERKNEKSRESE